MLNHIRGSIYSLAPASVVIEANGIGYEINISLETFSALEGRKEAVLLVHEIIREDTHDLYGFAEESERRLFRMLIGVSGVGANTARMILSSFKVAELEQIIASGQHAALKSVKGIGSKTAERVIVDLRDKIKPGEVTLLLKSALNNEAFDEALSALMMLGFARPQSQKVLKKIFEGDPNIKVEAAIKKALSMM
ncbi:MAG: Holliday junction branch migration protein RuvA [Muribaculaceae bacterium]|nr:Holliday junction branch migration protein RuvA [Muribaculaceae bacterium]